MFRLFFNGINRLTDILAGFMVLSLCIVVSIQIISRLTGVSTPWTEELTRYVFIWVVFLGMSIGFRKVESPRVTFIQKYFPSYFEFVFLWIYFIGSIGFFLFMIVYGYQFSQQQLITSETSSVLKLPVWIIGSVVPFSGVIGLINVIQSMLYERDTIKKGS